MPDKDIIELKQEIVEARNQVIKTDNQVRNIGLDVKGFEKRFDALERRTRLASVGAHLIVALTIGTAATVVTLVRSSNHEAQLAKLTDEAGAARDEALSKQKMLDEKIASFEAQRARGKQSRTVALEILEHIRAKREEEAIALLSKVHLDDLTELEREVVGGQVTDLRRRTGELAYRAGRALVDRGRPSQSVEEFQRSLELDPEGPYSHNARYWLAVVLYRKKRFEEVVPVLRKLRELSSDKNVKDEARYLLGTSLARLGQKEEARSILRAAASSGKFQAAARNLLASMDSDEEVVEQDGG